MKRSLDAYNVFVCVSVSMNLTNRLSYALKCFARRAAISIFCNKIMMDSIIFVMPCALLLAHIKR